MTKITDFVKKYRIAIIWSAAYLFITWAILWALFDFNIFSSIQWHRLMHAHLRGFPGFVFGILILSALPLYVATTVIVLRSGQALFTLPLPKFMKSKSVTTQAAETPPTTESETEKDEFPENMPPELRPAYVRARTHIGIAPQSIFNMHSPGLNQPDPDTNDDAPLPLPDDFDFDIDMPSDSDLNIMQSDDEVSAPTFQTLDF